MIKGLILFVHSSSFFSMQCSEFIEHDVLDVCTVLIIDMLAGE